MKSTRKLFFVGSAATIALICSACDVGLLQAEGATTALQTAFDDLTPRASYSLAQWQPESGYVPVNYPTDGSWERMVASAGH